MGGDGGTITKRRDCLRFHKSKDAEKLPRDLERLMIWRHCQLSQEVLKPPVVGCQLGRLYNKDKIIEYLLDKSADRIPSLSHIKSIKDVKTLKLTRASNASSKYAIEKSDAPCGMDKSAQFICPIVGIDMNGSYGFIFIWNCGCVLSERAFKEIHSNEKCPVCNANFNSNDIITIYPSPEVEKDLLLKIEQRAAVKRANKLKRDCDSEVESKKSKLTNSALSHNSIKSSNQKVSTLNSDIAEIQKEIEDKEKSSKIFKSLFHKSKDLIDDKPSIFSSKTHPYYFG